MGENSIAISPTAVGCGSAVLGLGAGYVLAPHKYSLERLLMQNEDSFNRHFSSTVMKNATDGEKQSLSNLREAAQTYRDSGDVILKNEIVPNAKLWHEMVNNVTVEDKFVKDLEHAKKNYLKAAGDVEIKELKNKLIYAQKELAKRPNDIKAHLDLKAASRQYADAQIILEHPLNLYKNAYTAFKAAREEAILNLPDKGRAISAQWDKVRRAISERANIMYEKLASLSSSESLVKDYGKIKKYIPKARTYSSLMGGILAGIAGVIAGVYSLNKMRAA